MASKTPSIQSFFEKELPSFKNAKPAHPVDIEAGDGFTPAEIEAALHPVLHKWQPRCEYTAVNIGDLVPGPGCVTAQGRIVNFHEQPFSSKMPHAAKGCLSLIVKDNTGAFRVRDDQRQSVLQLIDYMIQVKLHYAKVDYGLRLDHLVSIWMPHVSNADSTSLIVQDTSLITSIFPERDNTCYFMVQEESDKGGLCKTPLGYRKGKQLPGLITLKNYIDGGHEVGEAKVLVCVKSIGGRKRCEFGFLGVSTKLEALLLEFEHLANSQNRSNTHANAYIGQSQTRKVSPARRWKSTSSTIPQTRHSCFGVHLVRPRPAGSLRIQSSCFRMQDSTAVNDHRCR